MYFAKSTHFLVCALFLCAALRAAEAPVPSPDFAHDAQPLLKNFCFKCHGLEKTKGGVNFVAVKSAADALKDPKTWDAALSALREKEMPPEGQPQPSDKERELLASWIDNAFKSFDPSKLPKDPGRVTAHRLSRLEYNNTIRDLLGMDSHPADAFPPDGSGGGGFDNNADTLFVPPILMEKLLRSAGEILDQAPEDRLLKIASRPGVTQDKSPRAMLDFFASKAYRRPATNVEIDALMMLFAVGQKKGLLLKDALKLPYKAVLCSPKFLFRIELDPPGAAGREPHLLSDYELASRLSYFLWSSMPDDELFALADTKALQNPDAIKRQVARMLADKKAAAFSDSFCAQWLDLAEFKTSTQPDPRRFPDFSASLRSSMFDETIAFFDAIVRGGGVLTDFLDSDYSYLNEDLAKHYGIKNVTGPQLRRVALPDKTRGGLLCMGSILVKNSYPQRTSPVLRGKWVLTEMLGTPPPPPPPQVKVLPREDDVKNGLSFRKRLEAHRAKPECAGCHARMDPIGFGLENFDAVGRWRTEISGQKVDATGVLTSGEKFDGPIEMKSVLLKKKDGVLRNLAERMTAYALGRGIETFDAWAIKSMVDTVKQDGYKGASLVREIALSYPFRYRKGPDFNAAQE